MSPLHRPLSLTMLGCMLLASMPLSVGAASPFGVRPEVISLEDAYRLPGVFAIDLAVTQEKQAITGTFVMENTEPGVVGGMQYHIEIWDENEQILFERSARTEQVVLLPGEKRPISFTHEARALPPGTYVLRIQTVTSKGRTLGWADTTISFSDAPAAFVGLSDISVSLPEFDNDQFDPLSGPNVSAKGEVTLVSTATNDGESDVTVTPVLREYIFDMARGNPRTISFSAVTLKAGETKPLRLSVTAAELPEAYAGMVYLTDENDIPISHDAEYRWIVRGSDADVFPLRILQIGKAKGEATSAQLDVVGAPDAETIVENATLVVSLVDDDGTAAEAIVPGMKLDDRIRSGRIDLVLERDLAENPRIEVVVKGDKEAVLDKHTELFPDDAFATPTTLGMTRAMWFAIAAIALFIAFGARFLSQKSAMHPHA